MRESQAILPNPIMSNSIGWNQSTFGRTLFVKVRVVLPLCSSLGFGSFTCQSQDYGCPPLCECLCRSQHAWSNRGQTDRSESDETPLRAREVIPIQ